ncbi:MAG: type II secretion system protein [Bacillota bacterium]
MLNFFYKQMNKKGFSLIELVVVVGILGILAAVAIPRVTSSLDDARENADLANLRSLRNAVEMYFVENGSYPPQPANAAAFATTMATYFPEGIPEVQVVGWEFYYHEDATGEHVVYAQSAPAAISSVAWVEIAN